MKALTPLPIPPSYLERYAGIRDRKHLVTRAVLVANNAEIQARYTVLAAHTAAGTVEAIGPSPLLVISKELRLCYSSETKKLEELRKAIRKAQPNGQLKYCPYCQTTLGETDDHYLPAVLFPEFAVHPLNLVPACAKCNSIKGDDWLDAAGLRQYLQLFIDTIPAVDFLRVELITCPGVRGVGAQFELVQAGMPGPIWQLVESHFRKLDLIARYEDQGSNEVGEMLESGRSHREAGGIDVRRFFELEAGKAEDRYGRNHWRAKILRALGAHADVEDLTRP